MEKNFLRVAVTVTAPEGHFPRYQRVIGMVQRAGDTAQAATAAKQKAIDHVAAEMAKENPDIDFRYSIATAVSDCRFVLCDSREDLSPWERLEDANQNLASELICYMDEGGDIDEAIDSIKESLEATVSRIMGALPTLDDDEISQIAAAFKDTDKELKQGESVDEARVELAEGAELKGESDEEQAARDPQVEVASETAEACEV